MKKADRQKIFDKYGGRCAFCGSPLISGWHIWDVKPIQSVVTETGTIEKVNTEQENLMPACKECGSLRVKNSSGKMDINQFRREIKDMWLFCRNEAMYSSSVRRAIKFGLIQETQKPVIFYFETLNQ